jgi:hypothetical protein
MIEHSPSGFKKVRKRKSALSESKRRNARNVTSMDLVPSMIYLEFQE